MNVLISACLLGLACRYDGQRKEYSAVEGLLKEADIHLIPFCPEQGGGLATPRDPAERQELRLFALLFEVLAELPRRRKRHRWRDSKKYYELRDEVLLAKRVVRTTTCDVCAQREPPAPSANWC